VRCLSAACRERNEFLTPPAHHVLFTLALPLSFASGLCLGSRQHPHGFGSLGQCVEQRSSVVARAQC